MGEEEGKQGTGRVEAGKERMALTELRGMSKTQMTPMFVTSASGR